MKTTLIFAALLLTANAVCAKNLVVTVDNVRSNKGNILLMANVSGTDKPVYIRVAAKTGSVSIALTNIVSETADVSLFHDENGNYQMEMSDHRPMEGCAKATYTLTEETTKESLSLHYPTETK
ncbi:MAG: DUF2141 domain-containing protein [Alistipes sp.]